MPRKRRPRQTGHSSVHQPDPPAPEVSPSPTPERASQPTPELSPRLPPPPQIARQRSTQPGPSSSDNPWERALPLNWTESDCFIFSYYMYENSADFDDTVEWWGRIVPYLPGKTVQELRLFSYLYMRAYGELPPDPGQIPDSDTEEIEQSESDAEAAMLMKIDQLIENPELSSPPPPPPPPSIQTPLPTAEALVLKKYFDWTLEESRTLLDLIERNPSILKSRGGWKILARHFPGKKASDIGRHIAMVQIAAVFMGALNSIPGQKRVRSSADQDAAVSSGDQQPSTSVQADDSQCSSSSTDDDMCARPRAPHGESSMDSVPSTSGRYTPTPRGRQHSSSSSGRGGRRGRGRNSKK